MSTEIGKKMDEKLGKGGSPLSASHNPCDVYFLPAIGIGILTTRN